MTGGEGLPAGLLLAWYGDDFTGSSAVMEVLTFAGLPAVLFFDVPTPEQLATFSGYRAIGIAGTARSSSPRWMEEHLPPVYRALDALGASLVHYKICSTFDSSPTVGSIGKAIDLAAPVFRPDWIPLLVAAPEMNRYQAFGNLFASVDGVGYRLDRHPTMSHHPATPMDEADLRVHLGKQTDRRIGLVDLAAIKAGHADAALAAERQHGAEIVSLDVVDAETLAACGRLIWDARQEAPFAVGSQGVEYALIAHWRSEGLVAEAAPPPRAAEADRIVVVSGSCSPDTARQIERAAGEGFEPIRVDAALAVDPAEWAREIERSTAAALKALGEGRDPILHTALGPRDPAVATFNAAVAGCDRDTVNARVGSGLGTMLDRVLRASGTTRCVIAGGDTSGHGALALGIHALTAVAYITPGASIFKAHADDPALAGLEIALKGGQMGSPDYFSEIKEGGRRAA
ncbi:MAG: four-carbon acid sugar kinase family protein [Rhodobiaceae bacterium]|nr:four-carbon acid sugar kinase family protein [Rhodobiaceae bacterium]